jgi:hypothetical protein
MDNLARKRSFEMVQETGTVVRAKGGALRVATDSGEYDARRAVSCLVQPEPGDGVLICWSEGGEVYILAVLERIGDGASIALDRGDLTIKLPKGRFNVAAQEGVNLASAKEVSIAAGAFKLAAAEGTMVLGRLSFVGTFLQAEIEKVKAVAGTFDAVIDRFSQRVKRCYRFVEEIDQLRAEHVDYAARKNMSLRGRNALLTAEELVKLDGEQIHVG